MPTRKLFYIDTNCLIFARHYVLCRNATPSINEDHFPQGIRTGQVIVEALDLSEERQDHVDLCTSTLVNYEINRRFRTSEIKRVFLEFGIPLEAIDGRPQDVLANFAQRPEEMRRKFDAQLRESQDWYRNWEYRRLVRFETLEPQIFPLTETMPFVSPGIDLMDSLHVATALYLGAHYFVSDDGPLINNVQRIVEDAVQKGKLPNGEQYPRGEEINEPMKAIKPKEFRDVIANIRLQQ